MTSLFSQEQLNKWGIIDWGYTTEAKSSSYSHYQEWLERNDHGELSYLAGDRSKTRKDLRIFYPEFKSSLVFLFGYHESKKSLNQFYQTDDSNGLKVASYTLGFEEKDYHFVLSDRLKEMGEYLKDKGDISDFKITLDVHPVLERDLAYRAGLGWFGKNSMLIHKKEGSFFLIGSLLLDRELDHAKSRKVLEVDHCGNCRACIEACPTDAINETRRQIVANRCISTYTIEIFKDSSPPNGYPEKFTGEVFGCDICQDVCPWNNKPLERLEPVEWGPKSEVFSKILTTPKKNLFVWLQNLSQTQFKSFFYGTSFFRSGKRGLVKNLKHYFK